MSKALLIIDIQNDYFQGGAMELHGSEEASIAAREILDKFRTEQQPVLFVQHIASTDSSFFKPNTFGVEIRENIKPLENEVIITKQYPNSFRDTELLSILKKHGIKELVICGMMTHMCVDSTVRAAYDLGFNNTLIHDACATKSQEFKSILVMPDKVQASYMAAIHGTFAKVMSSQDFLVS